MKITIFILTERTDNIVKELYISTEQQFQALLIIGSEEEIEK